MLPGTPVRCISDPTITGILEEYTLATGEYLAIVKLDSTGKSEYIHADDIERA